MIAAQSPFPFFTDLQGSPLQAGYLYFGVAGMNPETNPINVSWDSAGTQPAAQPIRTLNGLPVRNGTPAVVYVDGDHSMTILDSAGRLVLYAPNAASLTAASLEAARVLDRLSDSTAATENAGLVAFNPALSYAAGTVGAMLNLRKAFLPVGNAATDAAALQAMIDAAGDGQRIDIFGSFSISTRINITKPVYLVGVAEGAQFSPAQTPKTQITWAGGTSTGAMIRIGKYGTGTDALWGGGIEGISLNGGGVCAHGLEIADASWGTYRNLYVWNVTASALHGITDGTKTSQPSAWNRFYNCFFDLRAALVASANAHGVLIEAVNGSNAGITLWYFEGLKVNHSGGDGVRWVKGGDGFVFMKPQFFRADSETGYSCRFASTDATDICNHCIFYYPIASAGMYFATPGLHIGTHIHCYDSQNLNSGVTELVQGPGASEVSGFSTFGQQFGVSRLHSAFDAIADDSMALVRYDSANGVAHTNCGSWYLAGSGTNVAAAAIAGSAIDLKTLATLNDSVLMSHCVAPNGVGTGQWPTFQAGIELLTLTNVKTRWGLFDSNADPAGDGIWIEFDPTLSSGQYRLICSRGGVQTVVVNSLGFTGAGISSLRWRIDVQPGRATFYVASSGAPNPQLWVYLATITTNVPITTTAMGAGVFLKTTAAAIASVRIGDMKLVQRVNYL